MRSTSLSSASLPLAQCQVSIPYSACLHELTIAGFHNADITKGLIITVAISSLTASLFDVKPYLHLQLVPHITKYHQFFRIAIHPFAFANSTELVVGLLALSNAGIPVERAFGHRKYAAFLLLSSLLSTFFALVALIPGHSFGLRYIPSGPYGVLFSLLWQKHRIVPAVYSFRIMGIDFSPKTFFYILVLQLILSDMPASGLAATTGLLTGYISHLDALPIPHTPFTRRRLLRPLKAYRLPSSIAALLSRLFSPIMGSAAAPRRSHRVVPGQTNESQLRAQAGALAALLGGRMGLAPTRPAAPRAVVAAAARRGPVVNEGLPGHPAPATAAGGSAPSTPARQATGMRGQVEGVRAGTQVARAAVGEWVSELAGGSEARAPTEPEIAALSSMFPNMSRDRIVRALQRNDYNTAQAVEALLEENT
ncbi:uncharacterized protein MKK02DRAFT_23518 [Dioszegia hungarica]|uniref:CUE domain-containing protein n=1 Tax=Dioszegia hungarica TaxID=4972 RepID=A0AA38HC24_9TREE|nr:uncharacterized protein MKK02DRAFT_23518 [Dioszegia hungarica]KAI9638582.1 hypothetical protein MKK02DRAFT_23518 [Dioszegia hungarica]